MNAVVSNNARKFRASRPDGISLPNKGNHFSTSTNGKLHRDTKPAFHGQAYKVDPYVEIEGIFFDIVPAARKATSAPKTSQKAAKPRARRQDPGAGTRPSLSTMRAKG